MASVGSKSFWEKLRWFAPATVLVVVMPLTLLALHFFLQKLGLTASTLILLVVTVFYSLGSGIWVAILLSLESDLYLNFYLTRPFHSFRVSEKNGVTTLIVYVLASTTVSALVKLLATKHTSPSRKNRKLGFQNREQSCRFVPSWKLGRRSCQTRSL